MLNHALSILNIFQPSVWLFYRSNNLLALTDKVRGTLLIYKARGTLLIDKLREDFTDQ